MVAILDESVKYDRVSEKLWAETCSIHRVLKHPVSLSSSSSSQDLRFNSLFRRDLQSTASREPPASCRTLPFAAAAKKEPAVLLPIAFALFSGDFASAGGLHSPPAFLSGTPLLLLQRFSLVSRRASSSRSAKLLSVCFSGTGDPAACFFPISGESPGVQPSTLRRPAPPFSDCAINSNITVVTCGREKSLETTTAEKKGRPPH
ncbi:hypothetical protein LXL04_008126 [Taraxacum kok-saghyz]